MHPLLVRQRALIFYVLFWVGLSTVPFMLLDSSAPLGSFVLVALSTAVFAVVTLPTWYVCRALPLEPPRWGRSLAAQALFTACWALAFRLILELFASVLTLVPEWHVLEADLSRREAELVAVGALDYVLVAALHYLFVALDERGRRAEREGLLALSLERAELQALRAQVHPHFLFNSLNTVSALIGYDPERAREACVLLAEYLRGALRAGDVPLVPLADEWALATQYLRVEALRLGDRLTLAVDLSPEAESSLVPSLLLQPLVENAITHGVAPLPEPTTVRVHGRVDGNRLLLRIESGIDPNPRPRPPGRGLPNVRARLFSHYAEDASLRAERDGDVFRVLLDLPREPVPNGVKT